MRMTTAEGDSILFSAQAQSESTIHEPKVSRTPDLLATARATSQEETFLNVMSTSRVNEG